MNKDTIKFLWELYNNLIAQRDKQAGEDYPDYDLETPINKLKERIDLELAEDLTAQNPSPIKLL